MFYRQDADPQPARAALHDWLPSTDGDQGGNRHPAQPGILQESHRAEGRRRLAHGFHYHSGRSTVHAI